MTDKQVVFAGDVVLPAIGQGTWYMGENAGHRRAEVSALRAGVDLGLTLIDTAEMYADGGAEEVVGEALNGLRERVFLVSKVYPWNAGGQKAIAACEASLRRLKTDYLDLYLLHWSGNFSFAETVEAMETLIAQGKIRRWGCPILTSTICRRCGRFRAAGSARPIRCCIIWLHAALNTICYRGVSNIIFP